MLKKTILAGLVVAAIGGSWLLLGNRGVHAQAATGGLPPQVTVAAR
jgi:membrane fusion protein, multidrug efflux system